LTAPRSQRPVHPPPAPLQARFRRWNYDPPVKTSLALEVAILVAIVVMVFLQFRGYFTPSTDLTLMADRSGLAMDSGSKVTYNGVEIGRVGKVDAVDVGGASKAKLTLKVNPKYISLIPANVDADVKATTVFGLKYVAFSSPKHPAPQRITSSTVIYVSSVTTEFNTLFETVVSVAQQVDPIKLNQTLAATADALSGLGDRFGQAVVNGNDILADLNPQMPQIRYDNQKLADLADVYADASPDLWSGLEHAVTTARTLNDQQANLDQTLMASIGFGNTGGDIFERGGPYLVRGTADLIPTSALLDEYSPAIYCTFHNDAVAQPRVAASVGGNGYSINLSNELVGAPNPWVYPDNLPRVNAKGGPEGRPGCWQPITRDLWPAPYLVMDTGASLAPFNHFGLGQPLLIEYIWGRQIGENTINP
jgi:phospholipid/cholesterol/gamma-HCH transport system substrate-binding protein